MWASIRDWFRCIPANPLPLIGYVLQGFAVGILIADHRWAAAVSLLFGCIVLAVTNTSSTLDTYQKAMRLLRRHGTLPAGFVRRHEQYWCRRQALKLIRSQRPP